MLFPVVVTVYATWWILEFFDNFFSPVYEYLLGFHVFGLGFVTSMLFIFATGMCNLIESYSQVENRRRPCLLIYLYTLQEFLHRLGLVQPW